MDGRSEWRQPRPESVQLTQASVATGPRSQCSSTLKPVSKQHTTERNETTRFKLHRRCVGNKRVRSNKATQLDRSTPAFAFGLIALILSGCDALDGQGPSSSSAWANTRRVQFHLSSLTLNDCQPQRQRTTIPERGYYPNPHHRADTIHHTPVRPGDLG